MLAAVRTKQLLPALFKIQKRSSPQTGPCRSTLACRAMSTQNSFPSLVEPSWLKQRLEDKSLRIIDGSWYLPAAGRDGKAEYKKTRIPGARFFDLNGIADHSTDLPHMLPTEAQFAAAVDALQIGNEDSVVVYDGAGIFSAPRICWTFKAFGHSSVAVLNGGMPAWRAAELPVDDSPVDDSVIEEPVAAAKAAVGHASYKAHLQRDMVKDWKQMLENVKNRQEDVIDARAADRFQGKAAEPRPGMRSGHIPGSLNVPFGQLLQDGRYRDPEGLRAAFEAAGVDPQKPITCSCGSGVTACILALGLDQLKAPQVAVYDGSWTEWGGRQDLPIE